MSEGGGITASRAGPAATAIAAALAVAAILLGAGLRVAFIGRSVMSHDEVYTVARAAGFWMSEVDAAAYPADEAVLPAGRVAAILHPERPRHGPLHVIAAIAEEEPHHAPPYYLVEWALARFGVASLAGLRAPSVLAALALILACGFIGRRLGGDALSGLLAAAVVALAPLAFAFSLEARPHLPALAALGVATAILIHAVRQEVEAGPAGAGRGAWVAYGAAVALVPYMHAAATAGVLSHAAFALLDPPPEARRRVLRRFALAAGLGALAYAPWALNGLYRHRHLGDMLAWTTRDGGALLDGWWQRAKDGRMWPDQAGLPAPTRGLLALAPLPAAVLGLRYLPRRALLIPATLAASAFAVVGAIDLARHSHASTVGRYIESSLLGLDLLLALGVAGLLRAPGAARPALGLALLAAALAAGGVSCVGVARSEAPSNVFSSYDTATIARASDARPDALVICAKDPDGTSLGRALALACTLPPDRAVLLHRPERPLHIPGSFARALVYQDATPLLPALAAAGFVERPSPAPPWVPLRFFERPSRP
jgi:hypothetical protein